MSAPIVFITREPFSMAGARARCYDLVPGLERAGLEAEVFSFADRLGAPGGADEHRLTFAKMLSLNLRAFFLLAQKPEGAVFVLQRVHYHIFGPWVAAAVRGFPTVLDLDDWEFSEKTDWKGSWLSGSRAVRLTGLLARRARVCLASSGYLFDFLSSHSPRTRLLATGFCAGRFSGVPAPDFSAAPFTFGWLGTLFRNEDAADLGFLLKCFRRVRAGRPDVRLLVIGGGPRLDEARALCAPGDGVEFTGWLAPDLVPEALARVQAGVFPSALDTRFALSKSPVAPLELMACSRPVICSAAGEGGRTVEHLKTGLLARDVEEFSAAMLRLCSDVALARKLGLAARDYVYASRSADVLAARFAEILRENGLIRKTT